MKISLIEVMVNTYPKGFENWRMYRIEYGGHAKECLMECAIWLPPNSDRWELEDLFSKWQPEDKEGDIEVEEIKKKKLIRNRIKCKLCEDIIESKYCHDFVKCKCGKVFVDGGLDYMRYGGEEENIEDLSEWKDIECIDGR